MAGALNHSQRPGSSPLEAVPSCEVVGECTKDPDRWATSTDDATREASKAVCRSCPRRWLCARQAVETPGAEGIWAGIWIPEADRGRTFAIGQLRSLAERGGYPVRMQPGRHLSKNWAR